MEDVMITLIGQDCEVEDIDRHTFLELLVGLSFLQLPRILLASIEQSAFLIVVFIEQLHLKY